MNTILITGGAGFIGSNLTNKLLESGYFVVCVDDFNDYYSPKFKEENIARFRKNINWKLYREDIRNKQALQKIFKKNKPDKIIHLAARAGVRPSIDNPHIYFDVNLIGTTNLLELARDHSVNQFIFGSSSSVYGDNDNIPFDEENHNLRPVAPYGVSKLAAEKAAFVYHKLYGLPVVCFRFFTVYGPAGRPDMAPYIFTEAIHKRKPITRFGKGKSARDYTYVDDIVDGVISVMDKKIDFEIINLGNSSPVSLNNFIKKIEKIVGKKAKIIDYSEQLGDVKQTFASIGKAKKILGWIPKTSIETGLEYFYDWYINSGRAKKNK